MTFQKPRPPGSLAEAVMVVASRIGVPACAKALGKSDGLVFQHSNHDSDAKPTLLQAIAYDNAFTAAGGDHAPLLDWARRQVVFTQDPAASRSSLAEQIGKVMAEIGELVSDSAAATVDGQLNVGERARLAKDVRDAQEHLTVLARWLERK